MLTKEERNLLEKVLDSLDRLFDKESTVADVHSLLVSTVTALHGGELIVHFENPVRGLWDVVQSDALPDRERILGLEATDNLRKFVAKELRRDAMENPRRRHVHRP